MADYLLHASIKHHPLFAALPEDSLWKVLAIVRTESLDAGAVVVGRGRPSSTLYIVRAGRVETSYDGGERLVGAGASFGELCVLGLSTVSLVDATCVTQSDFFFIHRDRFLNAFSNLPEVLAEMNAAAGEYLDSRPPPWGDETPMLELDEVQLQQLRALGYGVQ